MVRWLRLLDVLRLFRGRLKENVEWRRWAPLVELSMILFLVDGDDGIQALIFMYAFDGAMSLV